MDGLAASMTAEVAAILPELVDAAGSVIGAIAPVALTIAGMVAVVTLTVSVFRRLTGR